MEYLKGPQHFSVLVVSKYEYMSNWQVLLFAGNRK